MHFSQIILALAVAESLGSANAAALSGKGRRGMNGNVMLRSTPTSNSTVPDLTLDPSVIATGSEFSGNDPPVADQATSATSNNNFINFCAGLTLTNGLQQKTGSCNPIPMGKIPAEENTVSTIILSPEPGQTVPANQPFNVSLQTIHLTAGSFTNSADTYYSAPADLDSNGFTIGHVHVTIQSLGSSLTPTSPPDPTTFVFFLGIDDAGNGQGLLQAAVTDGLDAGFYRVCTMASSSNHQPVLSSIAKRGSQDDCTKFIVGGSSTSSSSSGSGSSSSAVSTGTDSSTSSAASASGSGTESSSPAVVGTATSATKSSPCKATPSATASASSSSIGGIAAPSVTNSGDADRPFLVNGNTFVNESAAVQRACSIQNNACSNAVNSGAVTGFTVGDCETQETSCNAAS